MGRANGKRRPDVVTRASVAPQSAAEVLLTGTGVTVPPVEAKRQPEGEALFNVRGVVLFRPDSSALTVPTTHDPELPEPCYPVMPLEPSARRAFDGAMWQLAVRQGQVHSADEWCEILWRQGIGTKAINRRGKGTKLDARTFRDEAHGWAETYWLPFSSILKLDDGSTRGFGVCRDREQSDAYAAHNTGRAAAQSTTLIAMEEGSAKWWGTPEPDRSTWPLQTMGLSPLKRERSVRLLHELLGHGNSPVTASELVGPVLSDDGLRFEAALSPNEASGTQGTGTSQIRALITVLRTSGVPIIASSGRDAGLGYSIARDQDALQKYISGETNDEARNSLTSAHAKATGQAGKLWYPQTDKEANIARIWSSQRLGAVVSSQVETKRARTRAQSSHTKHTKADIQAAAGKAYEGLIKSEMLAVIRWKGFQNQKLTKQEREYQLELHDADKARKTGQWPKRRKDASGRFYQYAWDLRSAPAPKSMVV